MKTGASRCFRIRRTGYTLRFYNSTISRELFLHPDTRTREERLYARLLRAGDTVVDVGANVGHLALAASRIVGPRGFVYAFEVHPRIVRYLRANVALNRAHHIVVYPYAVSDRDGFLGFDGSKGDDQTFVQPMGSITAVRLDSVLPGTRPIRLLKVDTEGYERAVLDGAADVLRRTDYVWIECYADLCARFGSTQQDVAERLARAGLSLYRLDENEQVILVDAARLPRRLNLLAARVPLY